MAREYDVIHLTEGRYDYDLWVPINGKPTMSNDGRRVVFPSKIEPGRWGYSLRLYDSESAEEGPQVLSVPSDGGDAVLISSFAQISGNGEKIIFDSLFGYVGDFQSGIYVYDIDSGTIRRVVTDNVPRWDTGVEMTGQPGSTKRVAKWPSISSDGSMITYVWETYEYSGSARDNWAPTQQSLMIADISGDQITGGDITKLTMERVSGYRFYPPSISGDGRTVAFYAGGVLEGLEVDNLEMPPYEAVTHSELSSPACDVYCYVARIQGPGSYILSVVPDPDAPTEPLVVAHPQSNSANSFNLDNVLYDNRPSISNSGSRIAINAGFVMRSQKTGVYIYEPLDAITRRIVSFGYTPGASTRPNLVTGAAPAISADGLSLAYCLRRVIFPDGYPGGDYSPYEDERSYCPSVEEDEMVVHEIPFGDRSPLINTESNPRDALFTSSMGLDIDENGSHVTFVSRADKDGTNYDRSHEVFYATMTSQS